MKKNLANSVLIITSFTIAAFYLYSRMFESSEIRTKKVMTYQQNVLSFFRLNNIKSISLKNKQGLFKIEKHQGNGTEDWALVHPRNFPAEMQTVNQILENLNQIKILKTRRKDPINLANFSLDSPPIVLKIENLKGYFNEFNFGLVNPINQTSYFTSSLEESKIFETLPPAFDLSSIGLTEFIDKEIFDFEEYNIYALKMIRSRNIFINARKRDDQWKSDKGKSLNSKKIQKLITDLKKYNANIIIDRFNVEAAKEIEQYISKPLYEIQVRPTDKEAKLITYKISHLVSKLSGLDIKKRENVLISSSNRKFAYLVKKDILKLLGYTGEWKLR